MNGSVIVSGKLYQDVHFVSTPEEADIEVIYDSMGYDKESDTWLYLYHGYLVATAKGEDSKMLILSRCIDESIIIGDNIEVTICDIRGDKVRLGITAPKDILVHRREVYEAIQKEKENR